MNTKSSAPILVVATTNRPNSLTQVVASHYIKLLLQQGSHATLLSLVDLPADFTQSALYANQGKNEQFNQLAEQINIAHKFVFIVPQYNGSFPGVFKTFIDGLTEPRRIFANKKCALVGLSKGFQGAIIALSHLADICMYLGMIVYPLQPKLHSIIEPNLAAVGSHLAYLPLLQKQATGFIHF